MNTLEKVKEFHLAFGIPIRNSPYGAFSDLDFRVGLLKEEIKELELATNHTDILDALTDIQYTLDGTYLQLGFHLFKDEAFQIVHESNMKKLQPNGSCIKRSDGKILKPDGWLPPNLEKLLE